MNRKVAVIGWDGATRQVIERGINEGWLPTLKSFISNGSFLNLISTIPPATIPAWTSCFTGVNPGKHGYFDFTEMINGTYQIRFTNGSFRKFPAVWNWLTKAGAKSIVAGVPGTYPIEKINGIMISGFVSPLPGKITPEQVYPQEIFPTVKDWGYGGINESNIKEGWHLKTVTKLLERLKKKEQVILNLLENEEWDLFISVFNETDTVSHHFWMFWDESSPRYQDGFKEAIPTIYQYLDTILLKIIRIIEKKYNDCLILLVSDHGFQSSSKTVLYINNWLAQKGYLHFHSHKTPLLKDFALKVFPYSLQTHLFKYFKGYAEKLESRSRFSRIDWQNTSAFSEELDYFPSVRINLKGREPHGIIPEENYFEFVYHLCGELKKWQFIKEAHFREDLYKGPFTEKAPDIILQIKEDNGAIPCCVRSRGVDTFHILHPDEFQGVKGHGMNGHHKQEGILCISEKINNNSAFIEDIASTIAGVMQIPCPPLDGKPLLGSLLIDNDFQFPDGDEKELTPYEEWLLIQQMKTIGYWQ